MKRLTGTLFFAFLFSISFSQSGNLPRPRLVVGIVVDQMRWDYLYRFYDRYDNNGGFRRMLNGGFTCENTLIPYAPTVTACGHTSIYTGSVPAINGIAGNIWWDRDRNKTMYCTEDASVTTVGSTSALGKMSPKNMLVTSVCDELRLATNFRSKVIGIAIKDRGGILPAGHSANAAYWYDNTVGSWISSTYYMNELPKWVSDFNSQKLVDRYYDAGWNLLYPANSYVQSSADEKVYEGKPFGTAFPYDLKKFIGKNYGMLSVTPYGNTLTAEFAKTAIMAEKMGADDTTDFITISFSSPDYIGHTFGPNSIEAEDNYLRLDKEIGSLLDFLDNKVGKDKYTVFLSADHGVTQVPEFMTENRIPAGRVQVTGLINAINREVKERFDVDTAIINDENYQFTLSDPRILAKKANKKEIIDWIVTRLQAEPGIARAFAIADMNIVPLPATIRTMLNNGYNARRGGDIQIILQPQHIEGYSATGTTHGLWNPYDAHIPFLLYGWGIRHGKTNRETYMTDIAPTLSALLHIQMPSGCVGKVVEEALK